MHILFLPSLTAIRARLFTSPKSYSGSSLRWISPSPAWYLLPYLTHSIISRSSESLLFGACDRGLLRAPLLFIFSHYYYCWGPDLMTFDEACVISSLPPSTMRNRCIKIPLWNITGAPVKGALVCLLLISFELRPSGRIFYDSSPRMLVHHLRNLHFFVYALLVQFAPKMAVFGPWGRWGAHLNSKGLHLPFFCDYNKVNLQFCLLARSFPKREVIRLNGRVLHLKECTKMAIWMTPFYHDLSR